MAILNSWNGPDHDEADDRGELVSLLCAHDDHDSCREGWCECRCHDEPPNE